MQVCKEKVKNILLIIHKLNGGGAERCTSNLSVELNKHYNVFLVLFDGNNITYPYSGTLLDLKIPMANTPFQQVINFVKRIYRIRQIKKKYRIDCAISLLDGPNNVNVLSMVGERTIVSIRNCLSKEHMSKIRRWFIKFASRRSDVTIALSRYVKYDLVKNFGVREDKIIPIYNHIDRGLLDELIDKEYREYSKDVFKFVTMGRLHHQKGQWHLLKAFSMVVKEHPNAYLDILGDGDYMQRLKELSKNLGIADHVKFLGYVENPHVYLKASDVFVFPSLYEGLGNVLLEALAYNLPIVSTDCEAGPREILAPDTDMQYSCGNIEYAKYGILVPAFDNSEDFSTIVNDKERTLAKAMNILIEDKKLLTKYRNSAPERVRDFDKHTIISQWIEVINSAGV